MNDRIRELADDALVYANATWNPESDANLFVAIAMEKHAELIIEEMYAFIMEESANDNGIPDLGKVKKHFGVK